MRGTKILSIIVVLAMMWLVTGCTGASNPNSGMIEEQTTSSTTNEKTSSHSFPKTIKHMKGETVIQNKPMKIASPYIAFVDYLAVLDEYPYAASGISTIKQNFPNLSKRLEGKAIIDLGTEASMEKLLSSKPDLIIAADDMIGQYEQLSQIAPTVILPQAGDWRETLEQIAAVIGKEDVATKILADFDQKSADYKKKLAFRSQESVLFTMARSKDQFVTWEEKRFEPFYKGLGLKPVQGAEKGGQLSLESLAQLNPDHLFVINNWQDPIPGGVKEALKDNQVWNSLKAVKNNQVYFLEDPSLPGPMALAKIDGLEEIMQAMGKK
ncbi:iron-siderophore ABC transporter substrate-binding protein [Brevibacillus laterosporus]|uniref:Iron-siderophore ABC transporter substrate-binding protein n=1 Tax=Brevibacillus laterosporus TaxID=1465 RepID=A0AAP3GDB4_BRELA|nr:iron-siderophore ABC transporter substrate-binding protein [Brevibacillus laterosporus]MCR8982859.1 iron-siderophore ABC transporter substrate-binding protein [Brevibacillus laterosporus]MCZ0810015.1 iron-siderophore ABC transporter substrate-binding protein [Brevibacillus laterosporus]MCZ0828626.1 iron-siderophore ABC transporter substrate-binding protein [Brevibacillus laterosporus]MCZ0852684.1 iron-siderophore ABC transporter substrate-binding protein [Brevibacillus laterosporus]